MNENEAYKKLVKFMLFMIVFGLVFWALSAYAVPGYPPTRKTLDALASVAQPLTASGTALPAVGSYTEGDLFILASTTPYLYRLQGGGWATMTSGTGGSGTDATTSANLTAHIASATNPHGASMTITQMVSIGTGPYDAKVNRIATGVVGLASAANFLPMDVPPTTEATGTVYFSNPHNHLMLLKSGTWHMILDEDDL